MIVRNGLGDVCTPSNCPNGPYDNPNSNYNYWATQGVAAGVVQQSPGSQTQAISPSVIQGAMEAASGAANCMSYDELMQQAGVENCGSLQTVGDQAACSARNVERQNRVSNLRVMHQGCIPKGLYAVTVPTPPAAAGVNVTNTVAVPHIVPQVIGEPVVSTTNTPASGVWVDYKTVPDSTNTTNKTVDKTDGTTQGSSNGIMDWLNGSLISGIPNWGLVAGAVVVGMFMMKRGRS